MKIDVVSFRPSDKCRRKLLELLEDGSSRSDVLEEAIDYYYAMRKGQLTDDPVFHLMQSAINESIDRWMLEVNDALESQRNDMQFVLAYLAMCLKGFGFDEDVKGAVELSETESRFKKVLDQRIAIELARKKNTDE